ncbi:response regulator transcription factor [Treponema brennaborense]|uniref:Two component transcriptional regulator, winged helix family n=1 Tax=Treponema brennaborense (strain DSM 12168 / CIP 105900 / DD5/3) TaxID=906968 RepID=F4LLE1_TREBD|nr:response regulator transcription factor [Treponema brennaborense]AEE15619.1 two component transcriptional regulator, winged helix family [Treponema brennaborense DSM 12168]
MKILVVDDEMPILELVSYNLQKEGFSVVTAENGTKALQIARSEHPDLIILDLMLPDMSGFDICRILRNDKTTAVIPIVMATAKTEDTDVVSGLELGADDYVTKPFSPKVLVARVKNILRRAQEAKPADTAASPFDRLQTVSRHFLVIKPEKFEVTVSGKQVQFSATEFAILLHLAQNPGRVFSRQQIINAIKGDSYPVTERSIDVQILSIRKKLSEAAGNDSAQNIIETVRGVGYRMTEDTGASGDKA